VRGVSKGGGGWTTRRATAAEAGSLSYAKHLPTIQPWTRSRPGEV